jgi:hypothetical protein
LDGSNIQAASSRRDAEPAAPPRRWRAQATRQSPNRRRKNGDAGEPGVKHVGQGGQFACLAISIDDTSLDQCGKARERVSSGSAIGLPQFSPVPRFAPARLCWKARDRRPHHQRGQGRQPRGLRHHLKAAGHNRVGVRGDRRNTRYSFDGDGTQVLLARCGGCSRLMGTNRVHFIFDGGNAKAPRGLLGWNNRFARSRASLGESGSFRAADV